MVEDHKSLYKKVSSLYKDENLSIKHFNNKEKLFYKSNMKIYHLQVFYFYN